MDDDSCVRQLVVSHGPIGKITGLLADGWSQVIFPFSRHMRVLLHERQRVDVNQPGIALKACDRCHL
jgi:hypothetical protein